MVCGPEKFFFTANRMFFYGTGLFAGATLQVNTTPGVADYYAIPGKLMVKVVPWLSMELTSILAR